MILVIVGHAIQSYYPDSCNEIHLWNIIYSFHMPAFMAISGWLAYRNTKFAYPQENTSAYFLKKCKRRAIQLLVPYFTWSFLQYAQSGNYTLENLSMMILQPDVYLWFLWALFWICVLFNLSQIISSKLKINQALVLLCVCLILLVMMIEMELRYFGFQFIAYYFLFYTIGYCLHKYEDTLLMKLLSKKCLSCLLFITWAFLAWGWQMHRLPSWLHAIPNIPSTLLQYTYRGFTALVAIVVLINIAPAIMNSKSVFNTFISSAGVFSLGMYAGHLILLGYLKDLLLWCCPSINLTIAIIVTSVFAFTLSYLLILLLSKNKITALAFLGKY